MSETQGTERLTIYSDYVCPFCYLGRKSLDQYQETREEPLELDWHPFDLRSQKRRPDGTIDRSADDGKDDDYYEQAKQNVERLRERYGADEMDVRIATDIDSLPAQVASFYVETERPEQWRAFDEAIFAALWEDGRDIGDVDVLAELADDVGLAGAEIREAVADEAHRDELRSRFEDAHRRGVTGVPTFAYDGYAARGAVPPEQLKRLVEGV